MAVLIWVGGMFFAYMVLRPSAVEVLEASQRLRLWDAVFGRFFNWVWGAIAALLISGFYMIYLYGGMSHVPQSVHIMLVLGLIMLAIYGYVYFACYVPLSLHVANQRWLEAGQILEKIRFLVAANLTLGVLTMCVVVIGKGWR